MPIARDMMSYVNWYTAAVKIVDRDGAEEVLLELVKVPEYELDAAQALLSLARRKQENRGWGSSRMDLVRIWEARAGKRSDEFEENRRKRYADSVREVMEGLFEERGGVADTRGLDSRLKQLGGVLAVLDAQRSANLALDVMELPGRWEYVAVGALESLLVDGVRLSLDSILKILDPIIQPLRSRGGYIDNQNVWLLKRCLCVLAFAEPASGGVEKIREVLSGLKFSPYELGDVVAALGGSRCEEAMGLLREWAEEDGSGVERIGEPWIRAVAALGGKESKEILLSFVDPDQKVFTKEFLPDHRHGDLLASLLAGLAQRDPEVKEEIFRLANSDLPSAKRTLLAKVIAGFANPEDLVAGLGVIRDGESSGIPYELLRGMENLFLERRPVGETGNAYTLAPAASNAIRKRLFEMVLTDAARRHSAFALLGQIEVWRLEHGRPAREPRHPALESGEPWPPLVL
jgi:hypothetical protein